MSHGEGVLAGSTLESRLGGVSSSEAFLLLSPHCDRQSNRIPGDHTAQSRTHISLLITSSRSVSTDSYRTKLEWGSMASLLRSAASSTFSPLRNSFKPLHNMSAQRAMSLSSYLVKPAELNAALKGNAPTRLATSPRVIPLCASWFMPNDPEKRSGYEVFKQGHVPSAR